VPITSQFSGDRYHLELRALERAIFSHLDFLLDYTTYICGFWIKRFSMHHQVKQSDSLVCFQVHLVTEISWLTQDFSEALDCLWEFLQSCEKQSSVVIVDHNFKRVCSRHNTSYMVVNYLLGVLETLCL
jgi:hypothetical protein